jgi:hypothetical protein
METAMWDKIEHNGYEVWVLPILAYGPPAPTTLWHYSAYICRHGSDAHLAGQSIRFQELVATFRTEEAAREAGYVEGKRRVDMILKGGLGAGNG